MMSACCRVVNCREISLHYLGLLFSLYIGFHAIISLEVDEHKCIGFRRKEGRPEVLF
jgi:hypothetical protein